MLPKSERSLLIAVTAAVTVVLVLAGLLIARMTAKEAMATPAPRAEVPSPEKVAMTEMIVPRWSSPKAGAWALRFQSDLDGLAPFGRGDGNAAEFFALFEKERGPRVWEASAAMDRRREIEGLEEFGSVFPFDEPLLLEAEPWIDQATMIFYPDIYPIEGMATRIPNLLFPLAMARTWTARGVLADNVEAGLEDCRRAIRLGRLLREEDAILINDLVGLACIRAGARGMFKIAQRTGDHELAVYSAIVIGEVAPQRLYTSQRITSVDLTPYTRENDDGSYRLEATDKVADAVFTMVTESPDKRFRGEASMGAYTLLKFGTNEQQQRSKEIFTEMLSSPDEVFVKLAEWCLNTPATEDTLAEMWVLFHG